MACCLALLYFPLATRAALLITTNAEAGGYSWNDTDATKGAAWRTNGEGTIAGVVAGNTYEAVSNGTPFGDGAACTTLRDPVVSGITNGFLITFKGDSLQLDADTVLRLVRLNGGTINGTSTPGGTPVISFPGVGGRPGLILNGGIINIGSGEETNTAGQVTSTGVFTNLGIIQVVSQSYINAGANGGGTVGAADKKQLVIAGQLTGSGDLVIFQCNTNRPQTIAGTTNTFSGRWIVKAGWLLGAAPGSLGTNAVIIDPNYNLPLASVTPYSGAAVVEFGYDVSSAGALILTNSGQIYLHQDCSFASVIIEGTSLSAGSHPYSELVASFPNTFLPGGSGSLRVNASVGILLNPVSQSHYPTQTGSFSGSAWGGTPPLSYHWESRASGGGAFSEVTDGGNISGSATTNLVITNLTGSNAGDYVMVVRDSVGNSATSSVATLTVILPQPATNITASSTQPLGASWDTPGFWSTGLGASESLLLYPGSTFELLAGPGTTIMRTPDAVQSSVFPGPVLKVDGDGVFHFWAGTQTTIASIRIKAKGSYDNLGVVTLPRLVMNGGQIDVATDNNPAVLKGEVDILTNTPIYNDGTADRYLEINSWLTGDASIEWWGYNQVGFMPNYTNSLNISCATNTYSGTWDVHLGLLLGSAPNALGTNNITVEGGAPLAGGALETTYDVYSPNATLVLNGVMYLHQNDTFGSVVINGEVLENGTYTIEDLMTRFPDNFPQSWAPHTGAANFSTASGSLTVGPGTPPALSLTWPAPADIIYGTALSSAQLRASANVQGSFLYTPGAGTVLPAGTNTLSVTFNPTDTVNYSSVTTNVTIVVQRAPVILTWATPAAIAFGTPLGAAQLNAQANVGGSFVYSPAAGSVPPVGTNVLSVIFTPIDAANYNSATTNVSLVVTASAPSLVLQGTGSNFELAWPSGYVLLESPDLSSGSWVTNNATSPYTIPMTAPKMFYRLQSQ